MWWIPFRAARLTAHVIKGIVLTKSRGRHSDDSQANLVREWYERLIQILQIKVVVRGCLPASTAHLWVANHISWLDIPLLGSLAPNAVFVSKKEVQSWPVIGSLATAVGTLFMQRGTGSNGARNAISDGLATGRHVVVFPEGTTTEGSVVKRFHARLFQSAIDVRAPILPIAIRYLAWDGKLARAAAYIDDDHILGSFLSILASRQLVAIVHVLEPIVLDEPIARDRLAADARERVMHAVQHSNDHY
jgi:1-acyl-sn-glycerol-3-phosphate acyltransferase